MSALAPARHMPRTAMRAYSHLTGQARCSRILFRYLFGFEPPPGIAGPLWDWTTLVLRNCLRRYLRPETSLLDMGTGLTAVLAVFARLEIGCSRVCAVDHVPAVAASARRAARYAGIALDIREGSLFDAVEGRFDVIAFNAPYIDDASGQRLGLLASDLDRLRYAGGSDGLQTVQSFLSQAARFLAPAGHVLLGVNHFYVTPQAVEELALRHGWTVERTFRSRLTHAAAWVLRSADS